MRIRRRDLSLLLGGFLLTHGAQAATESPAQILERQTRALLDAITPGDAKVWAALLDADAIYTTEDGRRLAKDQMVAEIRPLPAGISGSLGPVDLKIRVQGDTGVVTYDIDEHEDYFGNKLHAIYRVTETWIRRRDGWRLLAGQIMAVPHDPPSVTLPSDKLDAYVGTYALGTSQTYVITRAGDTLGGSRNGGSPQVLLAELTDVFFVAGRPRVRKIFLRDADGRIVGFVDRREGEDIHWSRRA